MVKSCACGLGQHFEELGHSFLQYGPTLSRQIHYLFFCSLSQMNFFNSFTSTRTDTPRFADAVN